MGGRHLSRRVAGFYGPTVLGVGGGPVGDWLVSRGPGHFAVIARVSARRRQVSPVRQAGDPEGRGDDTNPATSQTPAETAI